MMPTLSIIIPVYNAEAYLEDCLSSIIAQSYSDWECICVNDGSTDSSGIILSDYVQKDNRIKVINQENHGLSAARMTGLRYAVGRWILFVDSDDYVDDDMCLKLVEIVQRIDADVVGFSYKRVPEGSVSSYSMTINELLSPKQLLQSTQIPQSSEDLCFVWRYMLRRSFLQEYHIHFNEQVRFAEDMIFIMELYAYAEKIYLTDIAPYNYRTNNNHSIMHERKYNPYMEKSLTLVYDIKMQIIRENRWDELTPFSYDLAQRTIKNYTRMLMNNRKAKGESNDKYIGEVINLPMVQDAMNVIGYKNIYSNWKEYMIYLCMKFQIVPILKYYF